MAAINEGNEIQEITKKFQGMTEPHSSFPSSSSRDKSPHMLDLQAGDMAEEIVLKFRRVAEDAYLWYTIYDSMNFERKIICDKIQNILSAPMIIAMEGDQATGRRLVAFYVAAMLKCPLIKEHDFDNNEKKSEENQAKLWRNICSLALPQLTSGRCVVIDTNLENLNGFDQLKELSNLTNTLLVVFKCQVNFGDNLLNKIYMLEAFSNPVLFIVHEFVKKPTSQYRNSMNFNVGEIPIIMVESQGALQHTPRPVYDALMDLCAHIVPTIHPKNTDCDHIFYFTDARDKHSILCSQCSQLFSASFYRCQECRIIFHQGCSYFPQSLNMSDELMDMDIQYVNLETDADAKCKCCKQLIRSSVSSIYYSNSEGEKFDLECLFLLPAKHTAKIHKHELERKRKDWVKESCYECGAKISFLDIYYKCKQCCVVLDVFCVWLPETVQCSRDRHPLKLTILPPVDLDPYYCHGCEKERDAKKWIYYCEECVYESHPRCILKAPCLPRFSSTEISTTNKKLKEKFTNNESHSCSSHLSIQKVMVKELPLRVRSEAEELGMLFKELSKDIIKLPIIITMKGTSSSGRKLVASTLAATFDCLLIDEDSLCNVTSTQVALSQLQIGLSVVIDCDLSHESEFFPIRDFAFKTKTPLFIVEVKSCDGKKMQDFHRIVRSENDYDVGDTPKIFVDVTTPGSDHINKSMQQILHSISAHFKELSKEPAEIRFCYRHELLEMNRDHHRPNADICNGCSQKLLNPVLRCEKCPLALHKGCTKLPPRIDFYGHRLDLEKYGNTNDKVRCVYCNELIKDYAYICSYYDDFICFDLNCLFTPSEPGLDLHEHPLSLKSQNRIIRCGACSTIRKPFLFYGCTNNLCAFQIGVRCGWLKETVPFDRHRHPFQLIVSPEHVSNQYYCEVCGEERDKDHWVYCCIECDYFIHVRCIGLPETAYCPPSEYYDDEDDAFSVHRTHLLDVHESAPVLPRSELLEWPKKDNHRFLHVVYRVGDLDRTIKFYTECFGMKLLRKRDFSEHGYSNALLGFGSEETNFAVELKLNYGVKNYDIGTGFGHFAIATPDVYKLAKTIKAKGGNISREPGPIKGESSVFAFVKDPDGYIFKLIQRDAAPESLCQIMLRVGNLDGAIIFYEKALGMKMLRKIDRPEHKYTLAMMGYAEESETTVLELTYNYGVTEYTKGNAYKQIAISTQDVYKSGEVVNFVTQELGGKVTRQPGLLHEFNTKITAFLDPDGWKTVLVDNEYFLKELEKEQSR